MITNDFTKKELLALEDAMQNMLKLHRPQSGESPLINKLQSMIDNYCEHAWDDAATNQFYCIKCQKHIDKI